MADHKHTKILFKKVVAGEYTLQELNDLFASFQNEEDRERLLRLIEQHLQADFSEVPHANANIVAAKVLEKIKQQNQFEDRPSTLIVSLWSGRWKKIAAAVILIASFAGMYLYQSHKQEKDTLLLTNTNDISPGTNKATLTLSDGRELLLDDADVGDLAAESGISIHKSSDGQLVYTIQSEAATSDLHAVNTIRTPRGGQYQIILPDGTKVWLNSSSSLTYPVHFRAASRQVKMTGETYFEVAKSLDSKGKRIPFFVECPDQIIEVLGTHFNVNAYSDEQSTSTTLFEGSVRLASQSSKNEILLKPGQQAKLQKEQFSVAHVNVESAVDWKTGDFIFADQSLPAIMRKIARWYDVDIRYQQNVLPEDGFSGRVSRNKKLSEVIKVLSISADIDLKVIDKTIIVSRKKI